MQVQFSGANPPARQPLPDIAVKNNKGLPFEVIRDNLKNLAKFEVGQWPFINKEIQLIEIEEGPELGTLSVAARSIRSMKRKWYGAFDPNFVQDIFKAALAIISQSKRRVNQEKIKQAEELESLFSPALKGVQCLIMTYFNNEKITTANKLDAIWVESTKAAEREINPSKWNHRSTQLKVSHEAAEVATEGQKMSVKANVSLPEQEVTAQSAAAAAAAAAASALSSIAAVKPVKATGTSEVASSNGQLKAAAKAKLSAPPKLSGKLRDVQAALRVSEQPVRQSIIRANAPKTNALAQNSNASAAATQPDASAAAAQPGSDTTGSGSTQKTYRSMERKPLPSADGKSPQDLIAEAMIKRRKAMLVDIEPDEPPARPVVVATPKAAPQSAPAKKYPEITKEQIEKYKENNRKFQAELAAKLSGGAVIKKKDPKPVEVKPVGKLSKIQCGFAQFFNLGMLARTQVEPAQDISSEWIDLGKIPNEESDPNNALQTCEAPEVSSVVDRDGKVPPRRANSELYDRKYMQGLIANLEAELDQTA